MAEAEPAPAAKTRRPLYRHGALIALEGLSLAFLIAIGASFVGYRSRETVAQNFAQDWLRQHGVEGEVVVDRIDALGFSGRIRLGPANDPDLVADRLDVDYAFAAPWMGAKLSVTPRSIRLVRPRAKMAFDGQQLHFGSLDPLIQDLLKQPKTNAPSPDIRIDDGSIRLTTPYGLVQVDHTSANLSDGRVRALQSHLLPTVLKSGGTTATLGSGTLALTGDGTSLSGAFALDLTALDSPQVRFDTGRAQLDIEGLRYDLAGDSVGVTGKGRLRLAGAKLGLGGAVIVDPTADIALPYVQATLGHATNGRFDAAGQLTASRLAGPVAAGALKAQVTAKGGRFSTASSGPAIAAPLQITVQAGTLPLALGGSTVRLTNANARFAGRLDTGVKAMLTGEANLAAQGALAPKDAERLATSTPVLGQEPKYQMALATALQRFTLSAPGVGISVGQSATITARKPVELTTASGVHLTATPENLSLGAMTTGGVALALDGGGLPPAELALSGLTFKAGELTTHADLKTTLDFGPARDIKLALGGDVRYGKVGFVLTSAACAPVSAAYLDLGENKVEAPSAQVCPLPGAALVSANTAGWRLSGKFQDLKASVPFLQARTQGASGQFAVFGKDGPPSAEIEIADAPIIDTTDPIRFHPLRAKGPLKLAGDTWTGALTVATGQNRPIAQVSLTHDQLSGVGQADIDASHLLFAKGALQPADVSPVADLLIDAAGAVSFTGQMRWGKDGAVQSNGRFTTAGLDFVSPIGPVIGLKADAALTSLVPLISAPAQTASAASIDAFVPMKSAAATYALAEDGLHLQSANVAVAGGHASLSPMLVPFAKDAKLFGTVGLDDINLDQLVDLTGYADKIKADLVIDGQIPFEADAKGIRLIKGQIATVRPGRVEISREVLTQVESGAATAEVQAGTDKAVVAQAPATNAVQNLVYDAVENLAVDSLKATIDSLPSGRLGALFSIQGRYDPAIAPKADISLLDAIRGQALAKQIPLPKGTPVDLTLDTSLNFDELMKGVQSSFESFKRLHQTSRSAQVQR